ncbi:PREDICTED: uncharacterized protein LOC104812994 [Tarenaya hassleriana]|uniref:uncharacterized protein LOC104812994 n=1 Tax=Tarenaya hassleriana TaxID=28532 RepID=UPI00053C35E5|nr:PREDICTED: uncharacterized protein LOC104812994 [Tarenaya hassleriana]
MASDQEIAKGVEALLRLSEPNSLTSLNVVVQQLEAKLGLDLSEKADFIRDQINLLLRAHPSSAATSSVSAVEPSPPPPQTAVNVPAKSHFALHHPSQYPHPQHQQFPTHFSLQQPPHHSYDLNFQQPYPVPVPQIPPSQHQPLRQPPPRDTYGANSIISFDQVQAPKESAPARTKRKGGSGGLNKVCGVSPELQAVVGEPFLPRTEIVKQLWAYIRKNNLQDPSNKRKIICDDPLRVVFETDCTDMFKMNKLLSKHILPLDPTKESGQAKRVKVDAESTTETVEPVSSTVVLSEPIAKFFGTGETEMVETEVVQRVWDYIKLNHLEDPVNPMAIQCDEKLRDLLGCESISAVGINEMLRRHMYKRSVISDGP